MTDAQERRSRRREVMVYGLGVVAVILIWRGIWDLTAEVISPWTSLLIGLGLVGAIAAVRWDIVEKLF